MTDKTLHYTWRWDMPAPPQRVWPLVADTNAFNHAIGLGPWVFTETPNPEGGSLRVGAARTPSVTVGWEERPFQWVEDREFSVLRLYSNGPFLRVLSALELEPSPPGSTLTYTIDAVPRSRLWSIVARYYLGVHTSRRLNRVFSDVARYLSGQGAEPYSHETPRLSQAAQARIRDSEASLAEVGFRPGVVQGLVHYLRGAGDDDCERIKPYALADRWGEDRDTVLSLCLHATRLGLLELTWDVMCPLCRGAKDRASSLASLRGRGHCSSCNIQFDANFDRSVEVTFRPAQRIRELAMGSYCVGGPRNTPHILVQRSLAPGDSAEWVADLTEGTYRLRGHKMESSALLEVGASYATRETVDFSCNRQGVEPNRVEVAPGQVQVCIRNSGDGDLLVALERMHWPDDAVTAARITAMQGFRDIFASEVLAPEERFEIRYLTFMFTDLRSSTALYREQGDAPAFALVRDHFRVLHDLVAKHRGAVVKTIGDAVMAVFGEPGDAVAAGLAIHKALADDGARHPDLVLKMGIHAGPCIAVNLNGRLDYFGTMVNTAVRLQGHSSGGDLVMLDDLVRDPVVEEALAIPGVQVDHAEVALKGFDEKFQVCRVTMDAPIGPEPTATG